MGGGSDCGKFEARDSIGLGGGLRIQVWVCLKLRFKV